jgi:hypothetical protein
MRFFLLLLISAAVVNALPVEDPVPILDMNVEHVARLLARNRVSLGIAPSDQPIDGVALVDFIRWCAASPSRRQNV